MSALEDVEASLVGVLNPVEDIDADHVSPGAERVGVAGDVILLVRRREGGGLKRFENALFTTTKH
jgi:hypothetical protein